MAVIETTECVRDPCAMIFNGQRIVSERIITRVSDIRETAIGLIDFGYVSYSMPRYFVEDL